jgi:transposase
MEVVHTHCAGLDVHKATVVACRFSVDEHGHRVKVIETFGTTTAELLRLSDWLAEADCTQVAMESTGQFPGLSVQDRLASDLEYSGRQL